MDKEPGKVIPIGPRIGTLDEGQIRLRKSIVTRRDLITEELRKINERAEVLENELTVLKRAKEVLEKQKAIIIEILDKKEIDPSDRNLLQPTDELET